MHLLKKREEPQKLLLMLSLNNRMKLTEEYYTKYLSWEKGFIGEKKFDERTMSLNGDWLILNDLLLKYEGSKFQIDSLLLSQFALYQFEVKHFEGDYYINGKRFYTMAGKEINSPIIQIEKNETTLRQIVQNSVMPNLKVISFIVFTHPEFTLYQTPKDLSYLIFPTQLNKLMRNLNSQRTKATQKHFKFAEDLLSCERQV